MPEPITIAKLALNGGRIVLAALVVGYKRWRTVNGGTASESSALLDPLADWLLNVSASLDTGPLEDLAGPQRQALSDFTNHHLVKYSGVVLQDLIHLFIARRTCTEPAAIKAKQDETLRALAKKVPAAWPEFLAQNRNAAEPLKPAVFLRNIEQVLRHQDAVAEVQPADFLSFFGWLEPVPTKVGKQLAEWLTQHYATALTNALASPKAPAFDALQKTYLHFHNEHSSNFVLIHAKLDAVAAQQMRDSKATADIHSALIPPPVDVLSRLDTYARTVLEKLSPVPLTQILNQPDLPVVSVDRVYIPLRVRQVDYKDIGKLLHAKELSDWHGRETEHDAPEELKRHQADLADFLRTSPPRDAMDVLDTENFSHQIFLGEPGGGKTLFARHLVTGWAETWPMLRDDWQSQWISIYIELKHYAQLREDHTVTSVRNYLSGPHYPYGALPNVIFDEDGTDPLFLLIFDGLDEVLHGPTKSLIVEELLGMEEMRHHVIVTSRIADFDPQPWSKYPWCLIYRIDPFTPTEQRSFIQRYHEAFFPNQEERRFRVDRLHNKLRDFHRLAELAGTPLLLTLLCLVNRDPALPETRTELYEQAAELLLNNWDFFHFQQDGHQHRDHLAPLQKTEKHAIMRRLAWLLMMGKPGKHANDPGIPCERQHLSANLFPTSIVAEAVRGVLKELNKSNPENYVALLPKLLVERNSVLCPAVPGKHSFIHRTFLEFYAAWAWAEDELSWDYPGEDWQENLWPAGMKPKERFDHLFRNHWDDSTWHVILVLHFGRLKSSYAEKLVRSMLLIADECAIEAEKPVEAPTAKARAVPAIGKMLRSQQALLLAAEGLSETPERGRLPELQHEIRRRLQSLAESDYPRALSASGQRALNINHRQEAIRLLVQLTADSADAAEWLLKLGDNREIQAPIFAASLQELALCWSACERLRQHLIALAVAYCLDMSKCNAVLRIIDTHWQQQGIDQSLEALGDHHIIKELSLAGCIGMTNLNGLGRLSNLQWLNLDNCTGLEGHETLGPLAGMHDLDYLNLSGCTGLKGVDVKAVIKKLGLKCEVYEP